MRLSPRSRPRSCGSRPLRPDPRARELPIYFGRPPPMRILFIDEYLPQEMLGIMWVSRALKDAGHETKALFVPDKKWLQKLREYNPDVVCYSVTTGMHVYLADINRRVKQELPNVISVFGGPHPTFTPEYVETDGIDAVCRGEGEYAIVDLVNRLRD